MYARCRYSKRTKIRYSVIQAIVLVIQISDAFVINREYEVFILSCCQLALVSWVMEHGDVLTCLSSVRIISF
jgi:hypothetical protein